MENLHIQTLTFRCILGTILFFLFLITHTTASSSHSSSNSNQEIQKQSPGWSTMIPSHYHNHQVFYLKNTDQPMVFRTSQERVKKRKIKRNKNMKKKKKRVIKNMQPFSVMLPKGFVPPSGSSPCHNDQPNSVSFHCHLTTTTKP